MTPVRPLLDDTYPEGGNYGPAGQTKPSDPEQSSGIQNSMQQHVADIAASAAQTARYGSHSGVAPSTKDGYTYSAAEQVPAPSPSNPAGYMPKASDQQG